MKIIQRKVVAGQVSQWEVDLQAVQSIIGWAAKDSRRLEKEIMEMDQHFPYFYLTLASSDNTSSHDSFCPHCGELITFTDGIRCLGCGAKVTPFRSSLLAYIGQVPSLIGSLSPGRGLGDKKAEFLQGRPFLKMINSWLQKEGEAAKEETKKFFLAKPLPDRTEIYFSPVVHARFSDNWPRSAPLIFVPDKYFRILFRNSGYSQSDFHAYSESSGDLYKLCIYASWHTLTMRQVLQQRIVPKIIIDLMIADLMAVGKLEQVLRALGASTHSLYNFVGKSRKSEQFRIEYNKYIKI